MFLSDFKKIQPQYHYQFNKYKNNSLLSANTYPYSDSSEYLIGCFVKVRSQNGICVCIFSVFLTYNGYINDFSLLTISVLTSFPKSFICSRNHINQNFCQQIYIYFHVYGKLDSPAICDYHLLSTCYLSGLG